MSTEGTRTVERGSGPAPEAVGSEDAGARARAAILEDDSWIVMDRSAGTGAWRTALLLAAVLAWALGSGEAVVGAFRALVEGVR